jgi:hypothetical protein
VKHLYYPLYLVAIAAVILFNLVARNRRLSPRLRAAGNIAWGLAMALFMSINCEPKQWFQDFRDGYWRAGRLVLTAPADMYGTRELHFVNLPLLGLPCIPFGFLGEFQAGAIFGVVSLAVTVLAWRQLCALGSLTGDGRWLLAGLFLVNGPLFYSLREGNATTLVLPLLAAALAALLGGKGFRCGALLAVAGLIKPPLLLLPAYYTFRRRWRVAAGSAAVVGTAVVLSLMLFGADVHRVWYERCLGPYAGRPVAAYNSQSATSFLARFWASGDFGEYWGPVEVGLGFQLLNKALLLALTGGVLLLCLRRYRVDEPAAERLDFCLVLGLALLISPICWTHYLLLLLLPAALLLGGRLGGQPTRGQLVVLVLALLAMSLPVRAWALRHWYECLLVAHPFAGEMLLLALLGTARWRLCSIPTLVPLQLYHPDLPPDPRLPEARSKAA